jgi:hypothetical protein
MEEIIIKKHHRDSAIEYPVKCLPVELFNAGKPRIAADDLIDWSEIEPFREGEFGVSHVETLEIPERYVRGIVTHNDQDYVFSARVSLMKNMSRIDMTALIENVIKEIKEGNVG